MDLSCFPSVIDATTVDNCIAACHNATFAFQSLETVNRCFFTPYNSSLSPEFEDSWDVWGVPGNSLNVSLCDQATGLSSVFDNCLKQYCQSPDPDLGGCPFTDMSASAGYCNTTGEIGMCDNIVRTVNPDIGGIGVSQLPFFLANCSVRDGSNEDLVVHLLLHTGVDCYSCHDHACTSWSAQRFARPLAKTIIPGNDTPIHHTQIDSGRVSRSTVLLYAGF